jgi:dihydroorotase-like cyclic amidohydrolase
VFDLAVSGGILVFPGECCRAGEIGIREGRIAAVAEPGALGAARETVEARGLFVLPGLVDPHIHLGVRAPFDAECATETAGALAGGVTTVGCFLRSPEPFAPQLPGLISSVHAHACTDVFFHAALQTDAHLVEVPALASEFGVTSFKIYLFGVPGLIQSQNDGFLLAGMRAVAALGPRAVLCTHAENAAICLRAYERLPATGGTLRDWADANPDFSEAEAVRRAAFLASGTGVHLYIVHLTSAAALGELRRIRRRGEQVSVETTSAYLTLDVDDPQGPRLKRSPPLRTRADRDALWNGLMAGDIDTVGTDNVTNRLANLHTEIGIRRSQGGYAVLPTHLASMVDEGVCRRGLPLEQVVEPMTTGPARIFGLHPQKGTLAVGADADLALVDLDTPRVVEPRTWPSAGDWSPYEARPLRGWCRIVIRAGRVAARDGRLVPGAVPGRYLKRSPAGRVPMI